MTRDEWEQFEQIKNADDVRFAMSARCEEQGHEWENCASAMLHIYQACKWCGATKAI